MEWTTTPPTVPGLYGLVAYYQHHDAPQTPTVVRVDTHDDGGHPHYFVPGSDCPVHISDLDRRSLWCGPVVLPPAPTPSPPASPSATRA